MKKEMIFEFLKYLDNTIDYDDDKLSKGVVFYDKDGNYSVSNNDNFDIMYDNIKIKYESSPVFNEMFNDYNKSEMAVSMDCKLNEYLYNYDVPGCEKICNDLDKLFEKYGYFIDFGSNWYFYLVKIPNKNKE